MARAELSPARRPAVMPPERRRRDHPDGHGM